jgi:hypothetical protein
MHWFVEDTPNLNGQERITSIIWLRSDINGPNQTRFRLKCVRPVNGDALTPSVRRKLYGKSDFHRFRPCANAARVRLILRSKRPRQRQHSVYLICRIILIIVPAIWLDSLVPFETFNNLLAARTAAAGTEHPLTAHQGMNGSINGYS